MEKTLKHTQNIMEGEMGSIKSDILQDGGNGRTSEDMADNIDEARLYEKKFGEEHNDISTQKKPYGRDKTKDVMDSKNSRDSAENKRDGEVNYNEQIFKNRDKKGL